MSTALEVAALVWKVPSSGSPQCDRSRALRSVLEQLTINGPNWELWLVAGNKTFQPDNRVVRHLGFRGLLRKRGLEFPEGEGLEDRMESSSRGLRFFIATNFSLDHVGAVNEILFSEEGIIIFAKRDIAKSLAYQCQSKGWGSRGTTPPEEVLGIVCPQSGIVVSTFGDFDDREIAVAAIGKLSTLQQLKI